jgi:hypothetical protein
MFPVDTADLGQQALLVVLWHAIHKVQDPEHNLHGQVGTQDGHGVCATDRLGMFHFLFVVGTKKVCPATV